MRWCMRDGMRWLGFISDEHLTFSDQISSLSKSCHSQSHSHISELRCIRPYLDSKTASTIAASIVDFKLDSTIVFLISPKQIAFSILSLIHDISVDGRPCIQLILPRDAMQKRCVCCSRICHGMSICPSVCLPLCLPEMSVETYAYPTLCSIWLIWYKYGVIVFII